jgi:hypothetical protein
MCQRCGGQGDAVSAHQLSGLRHGECEVVGADLGQVTSKPVSLQWQRRVRPRRTDDAEAGLGASEQVSQPGDKVWVGGTVEFVQDQDDRWMAASQRGCEPEEKAAPARLPSREG